MKLHFLRLTLKLEGIENDSKWNCHVGDGRKGWWYGLGIDMFISESWKFSKTVPCPLCFQNCSRKFQKSWKHKGHSGNIKGHLSARVPLCFQIPLCFQVPLSFQSLEFKSRMKNFYENRGVIGSLSLFTWKFMYIRF